MLCYVMSRQLVNITDVSEKHATSRFRVQQSKKTAESITHCRFHETFKGLIKTPKITSIDKKNYSVDMQGMKCGINCSVSNTNYKKLTKHI